jgi:thiol-disulfide isomerase/thioredoxin/uncharacterized membrane protein YphA (DoxX/SURF4 family)
MNGVVLAARLLLAAVFALAGLAKLRDRGGTAITLEDFGVPARLAGPGAWLLPAAELTVAGLLLFDATAVAGALAGLALLAIFGVAISLSLARGERPDCNCFGQLHSEPVGASTLGRNAGLAVPAVIVLVAGHRGAAAGALDGMGAWDTATALAASALALVVLGLVVQAWVNLQLFRQHGRVLLRLDELTEVGPGPRGAPAPPGLPVGAPAPQADLPSPNGRPRVLAFVDPDCGTCRQLAPELAERQRASEGAPLTVVITRAESSAARAMAAKYEFDRVLLDLDGDLADGFDVPATPAAVAVGPSGLVHCPLALGDEDVRHLLAALDEPRDDFSLPLVMTGPGNAAPGDLLPDVELGDLDGRPRSLRSAAVSSGGLVLFWSPTCGYCEGMADNVRGLAGRGPEEAPLLVATGDAAANRAQELGAPTLLDPGFVATGEALGVSGTPSALRVDAQGRVVSALAVGVPGVKALMGVRPPAGGSEPA